jgi:hypothetical protein
VEKSTSKAQAVMTPPARAIAAAGGNGSALFVINLCASIAPVRLDGKQIPGLENYRLYQVRANEDGRTRHRCASASSRASRTPKRARCRAPSSNPTAFTACLCEEDRRFARGFLPDAAPAAPHAVAAVAKPAPHLVAARNRQQRRLQSKRRPRNLQSNARRSEDISRAAEPEVVELTGNLKPPKRRPRLASPAAKACGEHRRRSR